MSLVVRLLLLSWQQLRSSLVSLSQQTVEITQLRRNGRKRQNLKMAVRVAAIFFAFSVAFAQLGLTFRCYSCALERLR
jgi:hypothetical protein